MTDRRLTSTTGVLDPLRRPVDRTGTGAGDAVAATWTIADAVATGAVLPCRREDPELWFAETPADLETAKTFCLDCPVRDACLAGALERREPWGVWGGELFEAGAVIPRKRPRGRPRKEVAA